MAKKKNCAKSFKPIYLDLEKIFKKELFKNIAENVHVVIVTYLYNILLICILRNAIEIPTLKVNNALCETFRNLKNYVLCAY